MPEPGVGVTLKPVAAESEFIVVLFRFPGELLDERPPGKEFMLSAELNWLANICARSVDDSIDQCRDEALDWAAQKCLHKIIIGALVFDHRHERCKCFAMLVLL